MKLFTNDGEIVRLSLRANDLEGLITFLLRLAGYVGGSPLEKNHNEYQPVPVSEVSVGEFVDGDSYLGVTVGGIEIVYQLRSSAVCKVAEMLLTATADKTYNHDRR